MLLIVFSLTHILLIHNAISDCYETIGKYREEELTLEQRIEELRRMRTNAGQDLGKAQRHLERIKEESGWLQAILGRAKLGMEIGFGTGLGASIIVATAFPVSAPISAALVLKGMVAGSIGGGFWGYFEHKKALEESEQAIEDAKKSLEQIKGWLDQHEKEYYKISFNYNDDLVPIHSTHRSWITTKAPMEEAYSYLYGNDAGNSTSIYLGGGTLNGAKRADIAFTADSELKPGSYKVVTYIQFNDGKAAVHEYFIEVTE